MDEKLYNINEHFIKIVGIDDSLINTVLEKLEECNQDIIIYNLKGEIVEETLDRLPFYYTQKDTNILKIYPGAIQGYDDYGKVWIRENQIIKVNTEDGIDKLLAIYTKASIKDIKKIEDILDDIKILLI